MKSISFLASLFLLLLIDSAQAQKRILFIGNSYTAANNLPQLVSDLAASLGDSMIYGVNSPGGYTFELHSSDAITLSLIQSQAWDFVVLQEQSQRPSFPQSQVAVEVYPFARQLDSLILLNNTCTETVFFMTWGRKYGDASNCAVWPPVCTYSGMQNQLRFSYLQMANDNSALVAPCGMAWQQSFSADSSINLWVSDNSHPSVEGSYLNACVFYATLFRRSPVGATFTAGLSPTVSAHLQQVAHQTVFDSLPIWNIGDFDAQAAFSMQPNGLAVQFVNTSSNAQNASWDFGDGLSSTLYSPQHIYSQPGNYNVRLVAGNGCTEDTLTATLSLSSSGLTQINPETICIERRPEGILLHCDIKDLSLYSSDGHLLQQIKQGLKSGQLIPLSPSAGANLLVITTANGQRHAIKLLNTR